MLHLKKSNGIKNTKDYLKFSRRLSLCLNINVVSETKLNTNASLEQYKVPNGDIDGGKFFITPETFCIFDGHCVARSTIPPFDLTHAQTE